MGIKDLSKDLKLLALRILIGNPDPGPDPPSSGGGLLGSRPGQTAFLSVLQFDAKRTPVRETGLSYCRGISYPRPKLPGEERTPNGF